MKKTLGEYGVDETGEFIVVEHSAGDRSPNRVKKYRGKCPDCHADRGWVFKAYLNSSCGPCGKKKSYAFNGRTINQNDNGFKVSKLHEGKEIELKSSYELFMYNYLKSLGKPFQYEPEAFLLADGSTYRPDFFCEGIYYEIKGLLRPQDENKISLFRLAYPDTELKVLRQADLELLGYKQINYKKRRFLKILGSTWFFEFLDFKQYHKKHGSTSRAMTIVDDRIVQFNLRDSSIETIRHELTHVYSIEMGLVELQLQDSQIEELFCELNARHGKKLIKQADILNDRLRELKLRVIQDVL